MVGCAEKSEPAPEPLRNGVNDVRAACEQRASWQKRLTADCAACLTGTQIPPCGCELVRDFGGACNAQAAARQSEPSCTAAVDACINACKVDDCACIDACYSGADACRQATAARDGCVAEVCAPYCR